MGVSVEIGVLGPTRITVDGVVTEPPAQVTPLLIALAVSDEPISKVDLARDVLYLSPGSIDSRLSRLHRLLGLDAPLHRVAIPRSGLVELDRGPVSVDADRFRSLVEEAERLIDANLADQALTILLRADDLWRRGSCAWTALGDPRATTPFGRARDALLASRRHVRDVAARIKLNSDVGVSTRRVLRWTREPPTPPSCWHARIVNELDQRGDAVARASLAEWSAQAGDADETARRWAEMLVAHGPRPRTISTHKPPKSTVDPMREPPAPVGRELEFATLWRYANDVARGRGGLHFVSGGAGSGKSHLLANVQQHARAFLGLSVVNVDVEENTGFHRVLRQALTPLWLDILRRADPPGEVLARGDEIAAFAGGPTLDEPKGVEGREPVAPVPHAVHIVGSVLRAVDRPVLLVLDNIHRAAPELVEVLTLLRHDSLAVVGVLASFRSDDGVAGALAADLPVTTLQPFDVLTAGRFLSTARGHRVGDPELARIYRLAGGSPLALLHVDAHAEVTSSAATAPSVAATLGSWLASRSPTTRRALGVAAVLAEGTHFDLTLAEQMLASEPEAIEQLSAELDAGIEVHRVDGNGAFTHRAWQEVAYAGVEPHRRRALHRRVLECLERQLAKSSDPIEIAACAVAIAHHASLADHGGLATTIGVGALVRAADILAPFETATAITLYHRALQIARPDEQLAILLRQGRTRRLAAEWDAAETDLRAAADLASALGDVVAEAEATLLMAHMTWDPVRWSGTLAERLDALIARMPPDELAVRARLQACLAGGTYQDGVTGAGPDAPALAHAAVSVVDRLEPGDAAEVLMWGRKGLLDVEPPELTLSLATRMRRLSQGSSYLTANAILAAIVDHIRLGDDDAAREDTIAYRSLASGTGSPVQHYVAATLDAFWAVHDGDFNAAEQAIAVAERFGREFGGATASQVVTGQRVVLARERGDMRSSPELLDYLAAHRPADGRIPVWELAVSWLQADCGMLDAAGSRLRIIAQQTHDFRDLPRGPHRIVALAFAAEILFALDQAGLTTPLDRRTAHSVTTILSTHPDRQVLLGWPVAHLGPTLRYVGQSSIAAGDRDGGLQHLRSALRRATAPTPHRARILIDLATVLAPPQPEASRKYRHEAHRIAQQIGMQALTAVS